MTTRLPAALVAALALGAASAAPASAAPTITYASSTGASYTGTTGNDVNTLSTEFPGPAFRLTGGATPGTGCSTSGSDVLCAIGISAAGTMAGGDGDDTLKSTLLSPTGNATVYGDGGADDLNLQTGSATRAYGGDGSDHILSSSNTAYAYGGDGNDVAVTSSNGGGGNYGEAGNDILVVKSTSLYGDGGAGDDVLVFNSSNVPTGVGGAGADVIISNKSGGSFSGGTEGDIIAYGTGSSYAGATSGTLHGDDGDDRLYGAPNKPSTVYGDAGNDRIDTYGNGQADSVDCGADTDTAYVDSIDTVTNCETVVVGSAAPADAQVTAAKAAAAGYLTAAYDAIAPLP